MTNVLDLSRLFKEIRIKNKSIFHYYPYFVRDFYILNENKCFLIQNSELLKKGKNNKILKTKDK